MIASSPAPQRFRELDWLRAYGLLLAAGLHLLDWLATDAPAMRFVNQKLYFQGGVDLFFALSGFVISRALEPFWSRRVADAPLELTAFWIRRMWRLWPALALWAGVCALGVLLMPGHWPRDTVARMAAAVFYAANWRELGDNSALGYFWSLAIEWQFYLVLPVFLLLVGNGTVRVLALVGLVALSAVWRPFGGDWWMFRIEALLVGILVYVAYRRFGARLQAPRPHPVAAAALTALLLAGIAGSKSLTDWRFAWQTLAALLSGALVFLGAQDKGWVSGFGVDRVIDWLGSRSYSLYLCHIPVIIWSWTLAEAAAGHRFRYAGEPPGLALVILAAVGLAGELSYRFVERPAHRTAQRLGRQIQAGRAGGSALQHADVAVPLDPRLGHVGEVADAR